MIEFCNQNISLPEIETLKISNWIKNIIKLHKKSEGELTFIFCSDEYLLEINKEYLNHDYYTDIITFNYNDSKVISGDIFISLETVRKNSIEFNVSYHDELLRVIIHGILHLIGFNDKTDDQQKIMTEKEDEALNIFKG